MAPAHALHRLAAGTRYLVVSGFAIPQLHALLTRVAAGQPLDLFVSI
jgi:hypothetical protein